MSLVLRWRVPGPRIATRWRGPAGLAEAIEREPMYPVAAVVGPPGSGGDPVFSPLAVGPNATSPAPAGGTGSAAWSTVLNEPVFWDGIAWRTVAYIVDGTPRPDWVPEGALVAADFKAGNYWRHDIGICTLGDVWETGEGYNGPFDPGSDIIPGSGLSGSQMPQAVPAVLAMLDPGGAGFTMLLDGRIAQGVGGFADCQFGAIFTESGYSNEWAGLASLCSPAHAVETHLNCGDYDGPIWTLEIPDVPFVGPHRVATSIRAQDVAVSLNGLATLTRTRAQFAHEPKSDPSWNMLVLACFDHDDAVGFVEKVVFYPHIDAAELDQLTSLGDAAFVLDFTGGSLPSAVALTRASAGTYYNNDGVMQLASSDTARFDHDPLTLVPRGLLIEPEATNLLTYSEQLDNPAWARLAGSIAANTAAAPDGATTADLFNEDGSTSRHMVYRQSGSYPIGLTSGAQYTYSVFAQPNGRNFAAIQCGSGGGRHGAVFDLTTKALTATNDETGGLTGKDESIKDCGDYCRISSTVNLTDTNERGAFGPSNSGTPSWAFALPSYLGNSGAATRFWGAQLEAGPIATSYIPTGGSATTRAQDVLTISVPAGFSHLLTTYDDDSTTLVPCVEGANVYTAADFARSRIMSMEGVA
jgi:hypothetical protein